MSLNKKVLVIEDNEDVLYIISLILSENGYEVLESDSLDILSDLDSINPNLILLDNMVQGNSGSDMCKKLKSNAKTSHYPVVLISASTDLPSIAKECLADGFIEKPFDLGDFVKKLKGFKML